MRELVMKDFEEIVKHLEDAKPDVDPSYIKNLFTFCLQLSTLFPDVSGSNSVRIIKELIDLQYKKDI